MPSWKARAYENDAGIRSQILAYANPLPVTLRGDIAEVAAGAVNSHSAFGMRGFLSARQIRIFDYPRFAEPLRDRVRERAAELASAAGITIEHIAKNQRFALAKGEGGKEEVMSWMEVAIEYRKSVSGAIRRAQTFLPQEIQKNVIAKGQKLIDWNTKNSSAAKLSNTCRRLARDFIAQIGVARPLSEQFPKEMLLISERH
jgi:hypothetical protein